MKKLMSGNAAAGGLLSHRSAHAILATPITPQNELTEYMAKKSRKLVVSLSVKACGLGMVLGASVAGAGHEASSSGPGISLKQESICLVPADELPAIILNMVRRPRDQAVFPCPVRLPAGNP